LREVKRVGWPTRDQTLRNAAVVLSAVVAATAGIAGADAALGRAVASYLR
jgi:preprotein translocase SecE subunit